MSTFFLIVLASLIVSSVSFAGAVFLVWKNFFSERHITSLVSFAAGVMLASAFFDLLPEASEGGTPKDIYAYVFIGIVTFFLLERFVLWFHHHHDVHGKKPSAVLVLLGDGFHNVIDGVAIAAAFLTSPVLGITTTLAICAHEIPQEIGDFSILVEGGFSKKKALLFNFLTGLTALAGAIIGYFFLERVVDITWTFLAFSAGMFIYISCADLIPELHKDFSLQKKWSQTIPFVAGAAILWLLVHFLEG